MFQDFELELDELRGEENFDDAGKDLPNDEEILAKLDQDTKTGSKVKVRRPRPKLNDERLCGPRGIEIVPNLFEDFKIHGKGHEFEDLNKMMNKLEHWAHRLFPQMQFDDVLKRLENLGGKKLIHNTMNRIRYDEARCLGRENTPEQEQRPGSAAPEEPWLGVEEFPEPFFGSKEGTVEEPPVEQWLGIEDFLDEPFLENEFPEEPSIPGSKGADPEEPRENPEDMQMTDEDVLITLNIL